MIRKPLEIHNAGSTKQISFKDFDVFENLRILRIKNLTHSTHCLDHTEIIKSRASIATCGYIASTLQKLSAYLELYLTD